MDIKTRPIFGFLITGMLGNRIDYDARIMINKPVKADMEAEIIIEEDTEIEEYCKKVLDEKVKKEVEVINKTDLAISKCILPYTIDRKNCIVVAFGTIFLKTIRKELQEIKEKIGTQKYNEKDGVGFYTLTPNGKLKKLRKAVNEIVADYVSPDDYQSDLQQKTFAKTDSDIIKYWD